MKNQALFSSKDKSKKLKCLLLQFLFGVLRVNKIIPDSEAVSAGRHLVAMAILTLYVHFIKSYLLYTCTCILNHN